VARKRKSHLKEVAVQPAKERAEKIYEQLRSAIEEAQEMLGDDIGGFVLVPFGMRGEDHTMIHVEAGSITHSKLPGYIHDCVLTRIAIETAKEEMAGEEEASG
jgi:hypothetical protein